LILCDYNLEEGVTGAQVFKNLKDQPGQFLFLTGEEESEGSKLLEETPQVAGIIYKPISPKSIVQKIITFK
jgi:N-acetyl-gamma-glutamylphosphate reductase